MRQTACSCKQNIVEGIEDKTISIEMCVKQLGMASASARELREDYGDFLCKKELKIWEFNDPRTAATRNTALLMMILRSLRQNVKCVAMRRRPI